MNPQKKRLGEILIEAGIIDQLQLNSALGQQRQWGGKLGSVLIEMGFADEKSIASVLEKQLKIKCISLDDIEVMQKALNAVKLDMAKKYCIMPLDMDKNTLTIAISDPSDIKTLDELSFTLGVRVKPVLALESDIKNAIARHYEGTTFAGKKHKTAMEITPEKVQMVPTEPDSLFTGQTVENIQYEHSAMFAPEEISAGKPSDRKETFLKTLVESLAAILIEKGIISKEELAKKIKDLSSKG